MAADSDSDWWPAVPKERLEMRAKLLAHTRRFFSDRGVMEVDTPVLGRFAATEVHILSLCTRVSAPSARFLYLQTSPESAMKRLLAAGSGPVYQIARAFRDAEAGPRHNPEFVLLEWYRPGFDLAALMDEVEALVGALLEIDSPARRWTYGDAFRRYAGMDPFRASTDDICAACRELGWSGALHDRDAGLDLILSRRVQPRLPPGMTFVTEFPASQAALARIRSGDPPVAERFELFVDGVELANGYHELGDAAEQRRRFEGDLERRKEKNLPSVDIDRRLIAALAHGLPDCCGVALGFDRLVGLKTGIDDIRAVMPFPVERA